jgi:DNA-binding SARP family transcriptional activator
MTLADTIAGSRRRSRDEVLPEGGRPQMILVHTLGTALIDTGSCPIEPTSPRKFALLLHLAAERGRRISRSALQELIFPDQAERNARHSLRELVYQIRQFGVELDTTGDGVELIAEHVRADYDPILERESVDPQQVRAASGGFLPGYSPTHSEAYAEWYEGYRARCISAVSRALLKEVDRARNRGEWASTESAARACLALDPLNEAATFALAEMLFLGGSKAKATSLLDTYMEEVGCISPDLRLSARTLRRRIDQATGNNPSRFAPRFVGRSDEMNELRSVFQRSCRGNAQCVVVSGEPGIGKSRLLSEFRSIIELEGVRCEHVAMQPHDVNRPMGAFVDVVPRLLALPGALGCSPESMIALKRLVGATGSPIPEKCEPFELDAIAHAVTVAIGDVCESIAGEAPLVLIIEDAHSVDQFSISVLSALLSSRRPARVLILLSTREPRPLLRAFRHADSVHSLVLRPLATAATSALFDEVLLAMAPPTREIRARLVEIANGNPLFAISLADHYRATGDSSSIPATLIESLGRRLDPLPNRGLNVLATCIALGKHCTTDRLLRALELALVDLLETVAELADAGLLDSRAETVAPSHPMIAEVLATRTLPAIRAVVNFRVAEVFENDARRQGSPAYWWEAGVRWRGAGDAERALLAFRECARHAIEIGRAADAARILNEALLTPASHQSTIEAAKELMIAADLSSETHFVCSGQQILCRLGVAIGHDEFELVGRRAIFRDTQISEQVLEMTRECLVAPDASVQHRVSAAILGLKGADIVGNAGKMAAIVEELILPSDIRQVDSLIRLEFDLLLASAKDDWGNVAMTASQLLREVEGNSRRRVSVQTNCGIAFVLAGKPSEAIDALTRAFESAGSVRAFSHQGRIASILASINDDLYQDKQADEWASRAAESMSRTPESPELFEVVVVEVCRAFTRRNIAQVERIVAESTRSGLFSGSPTGERWGRCFAFRLKASQAPPVASDTESAHRFLQDIVRTMSGVRDFEVAAAAMVLGTRDRLAALDAIQNYMSNERPRQRLMDRHLSDAIRELESGEVRQGLSLSRQCGEICELDG